MAKQKFSFKMDDVPDVTHLSHKMSALTGESPKHPTPPKSVEGVVTDDAAFLGTAKTAQGKVWELWWLPRHRKFFFVADKSESHRTFTKTERDLASGLYEGSTYNGKMTSPEPTAWLRALRMEYVTVPTDMRDKAKSNAQTVEVLKALGDFG